MATNGKRRNEKCVLVHKRSMAQRLVREGYRIIDIKPDNKDENRTTFFFADENGIRERIKDLVENW